MTYLVQVREKMTVENVSDLVLEGFDGAEALDQAIELARKGKVDWEGTRALPTTWEAIVLEDNP